MKVKEHKVIKELKAFYDLPVDDVVYFNSETGNLHPQIIYNVVSSLKKLTNAVLELQEVVDKSDS